MGFFFFGGGGGETALPSVREHCSFVWALLLRAKQLLQSCEKTLFFSERALFLLHSPFLYVRELTFSARKHWSLEYCTVYWFLHVRERDSSMWDTIVPPYEIAFFPCFSTVRPSIIRLFMVCVSEWSHCARESAVTLCSIDDHYSCLCGMSLWCVNFSHTPFPSPVQSPWWRGPVYWWYGGDPPPRGHGGTDFRLPDS